MIRLAALFMAATFAIAVAMQVQRDERARCGRTAVTPLGEDLPDTPPAPASKRTHDDADNVVWRDWGRG